MGGPKGCAAARRYLEPEGTPVGQRGLWVQRCSPVLRYGAARLSSPARRFLMSEGPTPGLGGLSPYGRPRTVTTRKYSELQRSRDPWIGSLLPSAGLTHRELGTVEQTAGSAPVFFAGMGSLRLRFRNRF
jgi:hypothetical protein